MTSTKAKVGKSVIFLHIHKTAGTTLHRIIERHYSPENVYFFHGEKYTFEHFVSLGEAERAKIRILKGHMVFGMHEFLPESSNYFTLLRDPAERVISYYHHICQNSDHCYYDFVSSNNLSLSDFIESKVDIGMTNFQTRVLAGGRWHDSEYGKCPMEALSAVKQNFREHFSVVGLTERSGLFSSTSRRRSSGCC